MHELLDCMWHHPFAAMFLWFFASIISQETHAHLNYWRNRRKRQAEIK